MAISQFPSKGGIPSGNTASRPGSPVIGDTFYNGQLELLEIYNGTSWVAASAPPAAPSIATPTDASTADAYTSTAGKLSVVFTPSASGGAVKQYNAFTSAGGGSGSSSSTTVTISGLTPGTAYSVYGTAQNDFGVSGNSGTSTSVTPTTKPQAPTIGTASVIGTSTDVTVTWTLGSNGGKALSAITITPYLNGTTAGTPQNAATTSSTSHTFTGLTMNSAYTFKVKTTNANGESAESSATNSVTIPTVFTVDYLVVAGGGGGGDAKVVSQSSAGGGGAGGLRSTVTATGGSGTLETALNLAASTNYTVTVGAGGAAGAGSSGESGSNGQNSVFSTITSTGGGAGGGRNSNGSPGGSGGGAGGNTNGTGGTGTTNQGFAGGVGTNASYPGAGAGGGAAGIGGNGAAGNDGAGGIGGLGLSVSITGSSVSYAGGGAGGTTGVRQTNVTGGGGVGGGGNENNLNAGAGTANTGGGGGGGARNTYQVSAGAGGSGVVILRWLTSLGSITVGAGLTADATGTDGSYSYKRFTAGSGNVSFS